MRMPTTPTQGNGVEIKQGAAHSGIHVDTLRRYCDIDPPILLGRCLHPGSRTHPTFSEYGGMFLGVSDSLLASTFLPKRVAAADT